jgi:HD-GYP domain-containing protein (c-di-GMP phosphodiesterase class II)
LDAVVPHILQLQPSSASSETGDGDRSVVRFSEVIAAMSAALDLTEGQPAGHAARTCMIGMRLAQELGLEQSECTALYYALLMKDLGCSSNAAKLSYLFGADDRVVKRNVKTVDWSQAKENVRFTLRSVRPDGGPLRRLLQLGTLAVRSVGASRQLFKTRCERGAAIARELGFSEVTARAIRELDEHWDGLGYPAGLRGEQISLPARILGLAQSVEVFARELGPDAACTMAASRSGRWFDPELVRALLNLRHQKNFWRRVDTNNPWIAVAACAPADEARVATEADLDRIALAFAHVVDAKSPWTFRHSVGVADIAVGIAESLGYPEDGLRRVRRTALLHDLGKLGVSNLILDKPGKLTDGEFVAMRKHPEFTEQILARISCFASLAPVAGAHHERLDGRGYYRGRSADELSMDARLLTVADIFEALSAARPYRAAMPTERVLSILEGDAGIAICPRAFAGLTDWLARRDFTSRVANQIDALEQLQCELSSCDSDECCS